MEIKIYEVVLSSYESSDNYLHQESFMFSDEEKARNKFKGLKNSIKIDVFGSVEHDLCTDEDEKFYEASREIGTESEYQAKVELKEFSIDTKDYGLCETSIF